MNKGNNNQQVLTFLQKFLPVILIQDDTIDKSDEEKVEGAGKIFDYCMDFFRNPESYPVPKTNELFSYLWDKIGNNDGCFTIIDPYTDIVLAAIDEDKNNFVYQIYIPSNTISIFHDDPIKYMKNILFVGNLIQGHQFIANRQANDRSNTYNMYSLFQRRAYKAELKFLKYMQEKYEMDLSMKIVKVEEALNNLISSS